MISTQKKFLFIHVPKTGGNSVQNILKKYSEDKIVTIADHQDGKERFEVRNKKYATLIKHSSLHDYKKSLPPELYAQLFKFSIIRNPWDMMVSFYFSPNRKITVWNRREFKTLVRRAKPIAEYLTIPSMPKKINACLNWNILPEPKKDLISEIDFLIRFEYLNEDFKSACQLINIPFEPLPHRNKSLKKHYSYYYDEELKKMVAEKFWQEIEFGKYHFEQH